MGDAIDWFAHKCSLLLQVIYKNYTRGAELLPAKIIVPETDLYMRRLWGKPEEVFKSFEFICSYQVDIQRDYFWPFNELPCHIVEFCLWILPRHFA